MREAGQQQTSPHLSRAGKGVKAGAAARFHLLPVPHLSSPSSPSPVEGRIIPTKPATPCFVFHRILVPRGSNLLKSKPWKLPGDLEVIH